MLQLAKQIETYLQTIEDIEQYELAASLRRLEETARDIDFIIATNKPGSVTAALLRTDSIKDTSAKGTTKVSDTIEAGYNVSVAPRLVTPEAYETTLHQCT